MSAAWAEQVDASLKAVMVKVFVLAGETVIVYGLLFIPLIVTGVVPSVYVRLHGAVPVNTTFRSVEDPLQIVVVPLITDFGFGLMVMVRVAVTALHAAPAGLFVVKVKVTVPE
jgi:hypothetical protein